MSGTFDHIVIGGGSAGCVAAARLAGSGARTLVLEAGYSNRHPLLDMPPGIFKLINGSRFMRYHHTEPQPHLDGRVHDIPQGNVLGGGSSVNAQVYMRGRPSDYDGWQQTLQGNNDAVGWGWSDVLPHLRAMEGNERLHDERHGRDGPLLVSDPGHVNEVSRWFVQAVHGLGEPLTTDFNGASQRGVGLYQFMNRAGQRCSAVHSHLAPLAGDPNLVVRLRASVQRIVIEGGRARAVVYRDKLGGEHTAYADGEIVLSSGALVTPKLLMLSGIGDPAQLAEHGIGCRVESPGVGRNLIDHPEVPMTAIANGPYGYHRQGEGWRMVRNGLQMKLFGTGPLRTAGVEAGAFVNPDDPDAPPTVQAFCVPVVYLDRDALGLVEDVHGMTVTTVVVKPKSRGQVRLASADPAAMPRVSPNLLAHEDDMRTMIAGQRFFLRAMREAPLAERIARIAIPPAGADDEATLRAHCKRFVKTNYHPCGTARMGRDGDRMAVLDAKLRVRGVSGLRVCDLSAVPDIVAGNTNACAMMLGDRCAELMLGTGPPR